MMARAANDIIEYLHKCVFCQSAWYSILRISKCPKCEQPHIWFNGTSRLKDDSR